MLSDGRLFSVGSFDFQIRHLLIIAVLAIAFSTAVIMRSYPAKYGFFLNEFDPYFDYRATQFIVDNGLDAYWKWHDDMSWYPEGRDIAATSQSGLHVTAAIMYQIFGGGSSLLDFTIIFPVVMGSLTVIVVFALVRVIGGTTAGLFSALLFALSPAIIQRGNLGWFKSEPLGLFFGILAAYLFISAIKHKEIKYAIPKAILGGLILGLANASWGGIQYFSIPIALFLIALPFFRRDIQIPMYVAIAFTVFTLISAVAFPRPGMSFVLGLPGLALMGGTAFLVVANYLKKFTNQRYHVRYLSFLLIALVAAAVGILAAGAYVSPSFRYLNAINPFLSSQNPLTESVAEHFTPTIADYFIDYSILIMFAGFGAWMAFRRRNDMSVFALILGFTGVYVSATFARLLVFASIGIIVLAGLGLYEVTRSILEYREAAGATASGKKKFEQARSANPTGKIARIAYVAVIILMLSIPTVYPPNAGWFSAADIPPAIANGGSAFRLTTDDWTDTMAWIKQNTPKDAVIASWWDYGYWITTLGERTTLADNATINSTRIETIAKMMISDTENGVKIAQDLHADYVLVYVVGQRFEGINGTSFYTLGQGGEESKKHWIMRIGGFNERNYIENDGFTPKPKFWNNTLLGKMIPFSVGSYAQFQGQVLTNLDDQYRPGYVALYVKEVKYPQNSTNDQPLELVYSSPSLNSTKEGPFFAVMLYKVNQDYVPKTTGDPYSVDSSQIPAEEVPLPAGITANMTASKEVAVIDTAQGVIKIEFFPGAAPKHVENFMNLTRSGFYDGVLFHRIAPGFVIQAGDPNTRPNGTGRETWGQGGPGYQIDEEFNDIPHVKGIVSMARAGDPDSAGSQFFIVLDDARSLDNQYTVFGRVIEGIDVVDKIAALQRIQGGANNNQPADPELARINSITIQDR